MSSEEIDQLINQRRAKVTSFIATEGFDLFWIQAIGQVMEGIKESLVLEDKESNNPKFTQHDLNRKLYRVLSSLRSHPQEILREIESMEIAEGNETSTITQRIEELSNKLGS